MELPGLKLEMIEGPRKGDTLDFPPRSTIRIGRVVRGNNLTIKDSGISSKHLLIGCESGKWTVQDLGSSNGTALNSSQLPPLTPFDLRDGDVVKLGESTSITVHFGDLPSQTRRNPRRKVNQEDNVKIEVPESAPVEEKPRKGRPRRGKVLARVPEVDKESENGAAVIEKPEVTDKEMENRSSVAVKAETESVNVRVTRSRRNNSSLISENLGGAECLNVRVPRGRKNNNSLISDNMGGDCARVTRGGRGRSKKLPELPLDKRMGDEKKEELDTESKLEDAGAGPSYKETDAQAQVNDTENLRLGRETVDLEKMTLGQWFDFMELHLPKQITEATEKMIEEMRRKAERVHEYMIEEKKAKALRVPN